MGTVRSLLGLGKEKPRLIKIDGFVKEQAREGRSLGRRQVFQGTSEGEGVGNSDMQKLSSEKKKPLETEAHSTLKRGARRMGTTKGGRKELGASSGEIRARN